MSPVCRKFGIGLILWGEGNVLHYRFFSGCRVYDVAEKFLGNLCTFEKGAKWNFS